MCRVVVTARNLQFYDIRVLTEISVGDGSCTVEGQRTGIAGRRPCRVRKNLAPGDGVFNQPERDLFIFEEVFLRLRNPSFRDKTAVLECLLVVMHVADDGVDHLSREEVY